MLRLRNFKAFALIASLACVLPAMAGTVYVWTGSTSTQWNNAANWNSVGATYPDEDDGCYRDSRVTIDESQSATRWPILDDRDPADYCIRTLTFRDGVVAAPVQLDNNGQLTHISGKDSEDLGTLYVETNGAATYTEVLGGGEVHCVKLVITGGTGTTDTATLVVTGTELVVDGEECPAC